MAFAQVIPKPRLGTVCDTFQSSFRIGISLKSRSLSKTGKPKSTFYDLCRKVIVALWKILEWQAQTVARKNSRLFLGGRGPDRENLIPNKGF